MSDKDARKNEPSVPELSEEDAEELIRALGLVFSNVFLYGIKHGVTKKSMGDCFLLVSTALDFFGELSLHVVDNAVMVNTVAVERHNPLAAAFARHLSERDLSNFSLSKGLTLERFSDLMEILSARAEDLKRLGGLAGAIKTVGLQHVKAQAVVYKRVAEDETVVSKDGHDTGAASGKPDFRIALEFLRNADAVPDAETVGKVKELAADTVRMSEALVDAADSRRHGESEEENLTALVLDSLKRMYELLVKDKSVKTQKGKKELLKTLQSLETAVKERIRHIAGALDAEDEHRIGETFEGMADELRMDALVSEYLGKRSAMDKNEQRLLRFMKAKGLDKLSETELEQRLAEGGLTAEAWQALLTKSGLDPQAIGDGRDMPVVGRLADLLDHIHASMNAKQTADAPAAPETMRQTLLDIDAEVKRLVARTKGKIETLVQTARDDISAVEEAERQVVRSGRALRLPRRKLLGTLAEIAQEICQPLAVIQCSLDMMTAGGLGPVSDGQGDMLKLASESAQRLKTLTDNLMALSGLPESLSPDTGIQAALYKNGQAS